MPICYCRTCRKETEQHGSGFCAACYSPHLDEIFLPGDHVRHIATGAEFHVNSAHYLDTESGTVRRMFSVCGYVPPDATPPFYYQDECERLHRHIWRPYKGLRRCDCGDVFTTMADYMAAADSAQHARHH